MNRLRKCFMLLICMILMVGVSACGKSVIIDYADAASFENALNAGENLEGKVVQFTVDELHPQSALGYNIWAGEHLNFVSSRNPGYKQGDVAVVRATTIENNYGSWLIHYEKVDNAVPSEQTLVSADSGINRGSSADQNNGETIEISKTSTENEEANVTSESSTFKVDVDSEETAKALELKEYGWFINETTAYDDTAYVEFCTMIYNPNETLIAEFPKALVMVKNGDGSILATQEHTGSTIMPGDTITLCGMFSMPISDLTADAQIMFNVDCSDFEKKSTLHSEARTTDFAFSNVSERNGDQNFITGEITNNFSEEIGLVNLSIVLRKEGKIVYMENTFIDNLKAGQTKPFEFQRFHDWPEHDSIECSAMVW